jgi:hydrogenase expression/formation protein HypC
MCLAIPGQIQSIEGSEPMERTGKVSFGGVVKSVQLACLPDAKVGDFVMVHAGFAISIVDEQEAREVFKYLAAMDAVSDIQAGGNL